MTTKENSGTTRQRMMDILTGESLTARDISQLLHIREKEVHDHLAHISRSLSAKGKKLHIVPAECLSCGFIFETRRRFTRPGRCPRCKGERMESPEYRITGK